MSRRVEEATVVVIEGVALRMASYSAARDLVAALRDAERLTEVEGLAATASGEFVPREQPKVALTLHPVATILPREETASLGL